MESDIRFCPCGRIASHGLRCAKHKDKIIEKPKKVGKYSGYSEAYLKSKGAEKSYD
jgi:hypothetical protein